MRFNVALQDGFAKLSMTVFFEMIPSYVECFCFYDYEKRLHKWLDEEIDDLWRRNTKSSPTLRISGDTMS